MTPVLAALWGVLVATGVLRLRPASPVRVNALFGSRRAPVPWRAVATRTRAAVGLGVAATAVVAPPVALVLVGVIAARPFVAKRQVLSRRQRAIERDVGDIVTLIGLAVNSGHNLLGALRAAGTYATGPVGEALRNVVASVDHGVRLADALEPLPNDLGEVVRPTVIALVSCDRYGAPLGPTLDRLSADMRVAARQRAEAAARRLPIRLLFPLVTCILPAFGLLTVAPLIAGSLRGLAI